MPKLDNFFSNTKSEKIEQILTKKMHPQLISIKNIVVESVTFRCVIKINILCKDIFK